MTTHTPASTPRPKMSKSTLLTISLIVNAIFIVGVIIFTIMIRVPNFGFAYNVKNVYNRVCPDQIAQKVETKEDANIRTTTYYVNEAALKSGCANELMQAAQTEDYLAYPDHAKAMSDKFREIDSDGKLSITVVKSLENNTQLSPFKSEKQQQD